MKSKYQSFFEQKKTALAENNNANASATKYLSFFYPKKILDNGVDKLQIRILPSGDCFFESYLKHMFRTPNGQFKAVTCLDTIKSDGTQYSDVKCPICEFLNDNGAEIRKEHRDMLYPKKAYMMLIYNKYEDEIQKYEVSTYGLMDIMGALEQLGDDFDPDKDGFDIYLKYEPSNNGKKYIKVVGASKPVETVEEIIQHSKNFKQIKKVIDETYMPLNISKNSAVSILTIFIESYEPSYCNMINKYNILPDVNDEADSFNFGNNIKYDNNKGDAVDNYKEIIKSDMSTSSNEDIELEELRKMMGFDS